MAWLATQQPLSPHAISRDTVRCNVLPHGLAVLRQQHRMRRWIASSRARSSFLRSRPSPPSTSPDALVPPIATPWGCRVTAAERCEANQPWLCLQV